MRLGVRRRDCRPWAERKWTAIANAHARRIELLQILAPDRRCRGCGVRKRTYAALQIDHVDGRDWRLESCNQWTRVARYWREFQSGVRLQALCLKCNGKDGRKRQLQAQYAAQRGQRVAA